MTALKPIPNRRVRAVASERYPLNDFCASPMSDAGVKADDPHHCFPRSAIGGDSWFVEIEEDDGQLTVPLPHVVGLSREQHERVERHEAWIKLEDGVWNWYERERNVCRDCLVSDGLNGSETLSCTCDEFQYEWTLVGPLNPQPGSREGKPKKKRFKGEAKRRRTTISIRVPKDDLEDGAAIYDDLMEQSQEKLKTTQDVEYTPTPYVTLVAALYAFITA